MANVNSCEYFVDQFGIIFSFRMLKYFFHIFSSASMWTMYESLAFTFIFTKLRDNMPYDNYIGITFWIYMSFSGVTFLFSLCTCRKLYDYNNVDIAY